MGEERMFSTERVSFKRKHIGAKVAMFCGYNGFLICIFAAPISAFLKVGAAFLMLFYSGSRLLNAHTAAVMLELVQRGEWLNHLALRNLLHMIREGQVHDWGQACRKATEDAAADIQEGRKEEEFKEALDMTSSWLYWPVKSAWATVLF
jgi:hypothetical protein